MFELQELQHFGRVLFQKPTGSQFFVVPWVCKILIDVFWGPLVRTKMRFFALRPADGYGLVHQLQRDDFELNFSTALGLLRICL